MSMEILTILQTIVVFFLYGLVTCVLPFWLLHSKMQGFRLAAKLMLSYVIGNFYVINLVLILQLLHISNGWTLALGTVVPFVVLLVRFRKYAVKTWALDVWNNVCRVISGEQGVKTVFVRIFGWIGKQVKRLGQKGIRVIRRNWLDAILVTGIAVLLVWIYGGNLIENFGYCASDIPVHNYWINYMSKDQLFVAGVYPFGFHCVIYYLHAVFGLQTYVLLRVFCFVQTAIIHWMLLLFLKTCLKSRYMAYVGTLFYLASDFFQRNTYSRYTSSLPQEFGMVFILPAIYFGFAFFNYQHRQKKSQANWCLVGFAMNFSLTLAVHFYDTMIAGLFCVAMAVAFAFRFFNKKYFGRVVLTCLISVACAVLPMGIAYATGTPLQGSLGWGMNVLNGVSEEAEDEEEENEEATEESVEDSQTAAATDGTELPEVPEMSTESDSEQNAEETFPAETEVVEKKSVLESLKSSIFANVVQHDTPFVWYLVLGCIPLLAILSSLFFVGRKNDEAAILLTISIQMVLMNVLLISGVLGLPRLMDANRTSMYYSYLFPVALAASLDGVLTLLLGWLKKPWILSGGSLVCLAALVVVLWRGPYWKGAVRAEALEMNEAITCTTNILRDYEDFKWTIVSANDELRMTEEYGYHYETISLLRSCEGTDRHANVTIPTEYVFFYIEKVPLDYMSPYEKSGQRISAEGAIRSLPNSGGIQPYVGESRWVTMSRMYYWAEAFRKRYPESMIVYYETDKFICYRLRQNIFSLYELGIDYGYNRVAK